MEESRLIRKFAGFSTQAKRDVISNALNISGSEANQLINKITKQLRKEEEMLHYLSSKKEIDLQMAREIDKIKMQKFGKRQRIGKKEKNIRLHMEEIKKLRKAGATWPEITEYLRKTAKIKTTWVYIRNIYAGETCL